MAEAAASSTHLTGMDWSLIQSFLAVADHGSLSAAAAALSLTQPTLGRHIKSLEAALGTELFRRHARGLHLTETGAAILPAARAMHGQMNQISLTMETLTGTDAGTVRIACSVFAAHHLLPGVLADIRAAHPQITLIVQASDDTDNLLFREAEIALRMYRPRQLDLITRHLGDIPTGVFAARSYLDRRGRPGSLAEFLAHDLVGYDQSPLILDAMAQLGIPITAEDFPTRCDNQTAYWELVRAGCGIGFTQVHVGRADPLVEEIDLGAAMPALPVWLTAHDGVRRIPRVDRIWTALADGLAPVLRET